MWTVIASIGHDHALVSPHRLSQCQLYNMPCPTPLAAPLPSLPPSPPCPPPLTAPLPSCRTSLPAHLPSLPHSPPCPAPPPLRREKAITVAISTAQRLLTHINVTMTPASTVAMLIMLTPNFPQVNQTFFKVGHGQERELHGLGRRWCMVVPITSTSP